MDVFIKSYGTMIVALGSLFYTIWLNRRTHKIQKNIEKVQLNVLQASSLYENVKVMKREYVQAMSELKIIKDANKDTTDTEKKIEINKSFLNLYQKYTDFFNEIEDYCTKVNIGAINAEEYIKDKVSPQLSSYAKFQVNTFEILKETAKGYEFDDIPCPDYNAFKEYDIFLLKYNGGEDTAFWRELKTDRKRVGLE